MCHCSYIIPLAHIIIKDIMIPYLIQHLFKKKIKNIRIILDRKRNQSSKCQRVSFLEISNSSLIMYLAFFLEKYNYNWFI